MMSTKHLLTVLAVMLLCAGIAYAADRVVHPFGYPEALTIGENSQTLDELFRRFSDLANEKGAAYAFDVLRTAVLPPNSDIHLIAHQLGHDLYKEQGIDGMKLCTMEFGNGCSHAIVIEALQEHGDSDSTRALIDEACHKAGDMLAAYTMCYHGLGHGVFAFYGYSLPKTVEFCMKTGTKEYDYIQAYECVGGAAMELVSGGGHDQEAWVAANKKYFTDDPLAPCNTNLIPAAAKAKCFIYMSPHYMERTGANMEHYTTEQLREGMGYCGELPYGPDRDACISGFGKDFVGTAAHHDLRKLDAGDFSDEQMRDVDERCKLASDMRDVHVCESAVVSMLFWGGYYDANLAPRFCNMLDDPDSRAFCWDYLASSISHMVAKDDRGWRCELLPPQFRNRCVTDPQ